MLNLARTEAGRVDYEVERVVLADVVAGVMPMVEPQIAARELHAEVTVPSELVARADLEKVQQILLNLLTKAVKFTDPGGRIDLTGGLEESPDERIFLRVSDTGRGIPPGEHGAVIGRHWHWPGDQPGSGTRHGRRPDRHE